MDLLTLNLHKPLEWSPDNALRAGVRSFPDALTATGNAPEDAEAALFWDWDSVIRSTIDQGPRAPRPLPAPSRAASTGLPPSAGAAENRAGCGPAERLEPGRYLFTQTRAPAGLDAAALASWLADTVEWFAREAWWSRSAASGELIVRLVREDGKTAVQLIRKTA